MKKKLSDFSTFLKDSQESFNKKRKIIIESPYLQIKEADGKLVNLASFLTEMTHEGWTIQYFEELVRGGSIVTNNFVYLEYDPVSNAFVFGHELEEDDKNRLIIYSRELLIKIITIWNEVVKTYPKRIEIVKEGNVYTFTYTNLQGTFVKVAKIAE